MGRGRLGRGHSIGRVRHFQCIGSGISQLSYINFVAEGIAEELCALGNYLAVLLPNVLKRIVTGNLGLELIAATGADLASLDPIDNRYRRLREWLEVLSFHCGIATVRVMGGHKDTHCQGIARATRTQRQTGPGLVAGIYGIESFPVFAIGAHHCVKDIANPPGAKPLRPYSRPITLGLIVADSSIDLRTPLSNPLVIGGTCLPLSLHAEVAVSTRGEIPVNFTRIRVKGLILSLSDHDTGLHPVIGFSVKIVDFDEIVEIRNRILGGICEVEGIRCPPNIGSAADNSHDTTGVIVSKRPRGGARVIHSIVKPRIRKGRLC